MKEAQNDSYYIPGESIAAPCLLSGCTPESGDPMKSGDEQISLEQYVDSVKEGRWTIRRLHEGGQNDLGRVTGESLTEGGLFSIHRDIEE
jgi:hypothetical protein